MKKVKIKFLITLFILLLLSFSVFSSHISANEVIPISATEITDNTTQSNSEADLRHSSDLYIYEENEYNIKNIIDGNVFASVDTLNIDPSYNGGIISGNLYAIADTVNIKSNVIYSILFAKHSGNLSISRCLFISSTGYRKLH